MNKKRKHCFIMAAIMFATALVAAIRFDTQYWVIPCWFGFMGGFYVYVGIKSK